MDDEDLAQCVSIGGWIRGTGVVAENIGKAYTADRAELLNQSLIIEHLQVETDRMTNATEGGRSTDLLVAVSAGLATMTGILETANKEGFSALRSQQLGTVCSELVGRIREGK